MVGQSVAERAFEVILLAVTSPMGRGPARASEVVAGREMRRGGLHSRLLGRGEAKRPGPCQKRQGNGKNLPTIHPIPLAKKATAARRLSAAPFEVSKGASSHAVFKAAAVFSSRAQRHFLNRFSRKAQERCTAGRPHRDVHRFLVFLGMEIGVRSSVVAQTLR